MLKKLLMVGLCTGVASCMVKPKQVAGYDYDCEIVTRKIELTLDQQTRFRQMNCQNEECKAQAVAELASSMIILPLSAIVSGSIALTGNTLYWLEEKGRCLSSKKATAS
ncbi:hypothetical protein [Cellvibrio polysaccharolyticus]|uniref:hypothetical protein n=1 Tax=Cellvibrio polysaccharolyticus TaxID=2082724 RepID=UPI00187E32A6|nr:hypothetical protein [Cellvibrio polysaccharolyticus]